MDFFRALLDPAFMPHGHCYLWRPEMVWLQVVSNLLIGLAYVSISTTLFLLARRMRPLPFHRAYLAFGLFIVSCGATHFMDVLTVWRGMYWLDGAIRAFTAAASVATAIWLFPLFPQVVRFGRLIAAEREMSRTALEAELLRTMELQSTVATREMQMRELVDNLPELAWWARPDGHIEFYNRRWYEYTGTTSTEMQGWGWKTVHHPDHLEAVSARWQTSLSTGESFEMEFPLKAVDGTFRWFLTRVRPLRAADGSIDRWVGTNTDIDDRKRALVDLERSVQLRDEFLAVASHELRTPLAALVLQLQIAQRALLRGDDTPKVKMRLDAAEGQQRRLAVLVEEMLDVSRISLGKLTLQREYVDIVSLVTRVITSLQERVQRTGSVLTVTAPVTSTGLWDAARLEQVLTNLVTNALAFGAGKPITITVSDGASVRVDIRDEGIGIAEHDVERIFEKFERAVSVRNYGGLGVGLYLSREILTAHGGSIEVRSELGKGTTFSISVPKAPKVSV